MGDERTDEKTGTVEEFSPLLQDFLNYGINDINKLSAKSLVHTNINVYLLISLFPSLKKLLAKKVNIISSSADLACLDLYICKAAVSRFVLVSATKQLKQLIF